jgi:hypothetical protein
MRLNPLKRDSFTSRLIIISLGAIITAGLLSVIVAPGNNRHASSRRMLLPRAASPASAAEAAKPAVVSSLSPNWIIKTHGECCEGNLAAEGPSGYLLLPILLTGNQILRSDDAGVTWTRKYPLADASIPFGIEGDLQAWGNDVLYFGTELAQGVAAHSDDRGENWITVQIPVAFPANDQSWSYLGPLTNIAPVGQVQTEPYVLAGWYRIGSVVLFSFDGGLTWPLQTPLIGDDGSGPSHVVCQQTAHAPIASPPADTRIADPNFANHKAGRHGGWGTDRKFYWSETSNGDIGSGSSLFVCKTDNFGATWTGIRHPLVAGSGLGYVVTHTAFDNKGTLYVLHGDKLYVSFNQGESFAFVHTLPRFGDAGLSDSGADQFFVVNCGTIHVGLITPSPTGGTNDVYYLRGTGVDTATPTWAEELVDTVGSNRLDFFQIVLNGNGIPIMSYTKPDSEVTTASRNAPMPGGVNPCAPVIVPTSVVSRKTHTGVGPFDVNLPLTGGPGIECRTGGANGNFDVVFKFAGPPTAVSGATCGGQPATTGTSGNDTTVHCTGIQNAQTITVTINSVTVGGNTGSTSVLMGVLLGDTSANGSVNSSDVSQTKGQSGTSATATNFRTDVTINGTVNSSDVSTVKSKSGTALPP